jgi:polyribonucleotide nucleotidyltransferase
MLMSHDSNFEPDIAAMIGASAAVAVAGLPVSGVVAGCRVGFVDGDYVLNPSHSDLKKSKLDLVVAGTKDAILMVESEANELSEEQMLNAVMFGFGYVKQIAQQIEDFAKECGKPKMNFVARDRSKLFDKMNSMYADKVSAAYSIIDKTLRKDVITSLGKEIESFFVNAENSGDFVYHNGEKKEINSVDVKIAFGKLQELIVRDYVIKNKKRLDGRDFDQVRSVTTSVDCLPVVHGSGLFTRGNTQVMSIATLGSSGDEQMADSFTDPNQSQHFTLHYNFHSFSCGETSLPRAPGRREIGHGRLAYRALKPVIPSKEHFPYTIRLVAEVLESDGSTSMATVCSGALALMSTGVPIKSSVAGVAMGLIKESDDYVILTDIMADEDHLGDMDFKVAGTDNGITALQMDIKINGITEEIMKHALDKALKGRKHILSKMNESIASPRTSMNANAPQIFSVNIKESQIADLIGKGGANIKSICEKSGAKVDVLQNKVNIFASGAESLAVAKKMVMESLGRTEEIAYGSIMDAVVKSVMPFGVIIETLNYNTGLVHISEISNREIENIDDFIKEGDRVKVKYIGKDNKGRTKFSIKSVDQVTGEDLDGDESAVIPTAIKKSYKDSGSYNSDRGGGRDRGRKSFNKFNSDGNRGDRNDRGDRGFKPRNGKRDDAKKDKDKKKKRFFFF